MESREEKQARLRRESAEVGLVIRKARASRSKRPGQTPSQVQHRIIAIRAAVLRIMGQARPMTEAVIESFANWPDERSNAVEYRTRNVQRANQQKGDTLNKVAQAIVDGKPAFSAGIQTVVGVTSTVTAGAIGVHIACNNNGRGGVK